MAISVDDRFEWKLTKPGRWERDIDEVEEFYTSLAKAFEGTGRVFFAMTGFISFSVPVQPGSNSLETEKRVEQALNVAWTRLRFDHPTIASRVQYDPAQQKYKKTYETFTDSASQRQWLNDTFCVVSKRMSGLDWCNLDPPVPDLPTLFLVKLPALDDQTFRADLVLRAHHDIIDGMGTLLLFNNLFSLAADAYENTDYELPQFGEEWSNLSPPLRIAAGIPAALSPEHEKHMCDILEYNASLKEGIQTASPPFQRTNATPGKHQRVAVTLSEDETTRLLEKCRSLGLSITHAYHAAIALAVRDLQERKESERMVRYISYCLVNERNRCNPPYSTSTHPASVYHSVSGRCLAVDLTVPALGSSDATPTDKEKFLPIAQHIRDYYLDIRDNKDYMKLIPAFWAMSISPYPGPDAPAIPARNESPSASISSMGVLDKVIRHSYGSFSVENPWVTGEELGTGLGLFLDTWKGRLTLSAAYNDAWHGKEEVLYVLNRCNDVAFQGLGIREATSF
jgi:hypothetical protein